MCEQQRDSSGTPKTIRAPPAPVARLHSGLDVLQNLQRIFLESSSWPVHMASRALPLAATAASPGHPQRCCPLTQPLQGTGAHHGTPSRKRQTEREWRRQQGERSRRSKAEAEAGEAKRSGGKARKACKAYKACKAGKARGSAARACRSAWLCRARNWRSSSMGTSPEMTVWKRAYRSRSAAQQGRMAAARGGAFSFPLRAPGRGPPDCPAGLHAR